MAIESLYWKEELARIAKTIRPVPKPGRWSERAVCTVERDVMIGFFIVRRMIELRKVSRRITNKTLEVFSAPVKKKITQWNRFSIEENYDWEVEQVVDRPVPYICNQFIHTYVSFVNRGPDRNWADFLVVSDYDRNNVIWRIEFKTIIALFDSTAHDWPASMRMVYDDKLGDYKTSTE